MKIITTVVWIVLMLVTRMACFIPSQVLDFVLQQIGNRGKIDLGEVSSTIVHEIILRRGVIGTVTQFFIDSNNPNSTVSLSKLPQYYEVSSFTLPAKNSSFNPV